MTNKIILLGIEARDFLQHLEKLEYKNDYPDIIGGMFEEDPLDGEESVYIAFDCSVSMAYVEEFDSLVEAAKYASGMKAKIRGGFKI